MLTEFASATGVAIGLAKLIFERSQQVKRFREDCRKLAAFVQRIESVIMEVESDADPNEPGWQAAFTVSLRFHFHGGCMGHSQPACNEACCTTMHAVQFSAAASMGLLKRRRCLFRQACLSNWCNSNAVSCITGSA